MLRTDIAFSAELGSESWCGDYGIPVVDLSNGHLRFCDVHSCPPGAYCYRQPTDSLPALCCRKSTYCMCFVSDYLACRQRAFMSPAITGNALRIAISDNISNVMKLPLISASTKKLSVLNQSDSIPPTRTAFTVSV